MRSRLLAVAIAAGLGVSSFTAMAASAPQSTNAANSSEIAQLKAQLAALQAKVDSLEERTDAQSDINVSSGQAVAQATTVNADTDKRLTTLEKVVNNTSVGGKMYFDISNLDVKNSDTGKTNASGVGIDVKRFYLAVDHKFNDIWAANLTTDFVYQSLLGRTDLFVKKAYVEGKFDPAFKLRIGSADMPWIPFVENWYGFRYVEPTMTDRLAFANSADWGLHASGDFGASKIVGYAASVVNGAGYKNPGRSKGVDFEGRVNVSPFEDMVVAVGGYSGKRGMVQENTVGPTNTATRGDVLVAYANKNFRVGGEYFSSKDWNHVISPVNDKSDGYSVWGSLAVADRVSIFARYDNVNLSTDLDKNANDEYYNAGIQYDVTKGFLASLVYKHEQGDKSVTDPMLPPHVVSVKSDEIGIFGEVKF